MGCLLFTASTYSHIRYFHRPYLRKFKELGWRVDVACGGTPMELPEADRIIHIPLEKSMKSPKNWKCVSLLRREIRAEGYDLISCHTALASFFTRLAVWGWRDRPKVVCTVHGYLFGDANPGGGLLKAAEGLTAPLTDLLMTMNDWDTRYAKAHRCGRAVVEIPGMGLDLQNLPRISKEEAQTLRTRLGISPDAFLLLYGAEFSKRKNQRVLIEALKELPDQVVLLLPGDGALEDSCRERVRELGLEGRVIFPGRVDNMPLWYRAADGAVSSSRSEGLPFNLMEAMYYGLPIVASDVKGNRDLITHNQTGLLYPYGDPSACAAQIRRLLEEPFLREHLSQEASKAAKGYTLSEVLPQVMACYEKLIPALGEERTPAGSVTGGKKG